MAATAEACWAPLHQEPCPHKAPFSASAGLAWPLPPARSPRHTAYLNKAFRFSGNSVRPAYPGFMVMKRPTMGLRLIISPRKLNVFFLARIASWTHFT